MTDAIFLCVVNALCMITGIIFNSVVIVCLWKSVQLRRKPCYFMIFVLSCFDLVGVITVNPVQIRSAMFLYSRDYNELYEHVRLLICVLLNGFSMLALLTLNIERYLALAHPIFHRRSITKRRLIYLLGLMMCLHCAQIALSSFNPKVLGHILTIVWPSIFLFIFGFFSYKMFITSKSKLIKERVIAPSSSNREETRHIVRINLRMIGTCWLAVFCFFVCSFPQILYSGYRLTSDTDNSCTQLVMDLNWNVWQRMYLQNQDIISKYLSGPPRFSFGSFLDHLF
jgi:hypothetical protein